MDFKLLIHIRQATNPQSTNAIMYTHINSDMFITHSQFDDLGNFWVLRFEYHAGNYWVIETCDKNPYLVPYSVPS